MDKKHPWYLYEEVQPPWVLETLPRYIVATVQELKDENAKELPIRNIASPLEFPLTFADKRHIAILMKKFKQQPFYTGLAAPQLGIMKRVIVFTMRTEDTADRCRTKVWINPSYEQVGDQMVEDHECCVSIKSVTGPVKRYETVQYKANDIEGNVFEGKISGLTARIIQHEIDHLNGKLFVDFVSEDKLITVREYARSILSASKRDAEKDS